MPRPTEGDHHGGIGEAGIGPAGVDLGDQIARALEFSRVTSRPLAFVVAMSSATQ